MENTSANEFTDIYKHVISGVPPDVYFRQYAFMSESDLDKISVMPCIHRSSFNILLESIYKEYYNKAHHDSNISNMSFLGAFSGISISKKDLLLVPNHLIHDIYNLYYGSNTNIQRCSDEKMIVFKTVYKDIHKVTTERNCLYSFIFTREIVKYLNNLLNELKRSQSSFRKMRSDEFVEMLDSVLNLSSLITNKKSEDSEVNEEKEDTSELFNKLFKEALQKENENSMRLSNVLKKAFSMIDSLKNVGIGNEIADISIINNYELVRSILNNISISKSQIDLFFKSIMKYSGNKLGHLFTGDVNILDADDISDINELEYLLEPLSRFNKLEATVSEQTFNNKFDLYIDLSGSMKNGTSASDPIILAKAVGIKLINLGYVRNIFFFSTKIHGPFTNNDIIKIISITDGGGTSFNNVYRDIVERKSKALVITDGACDINCYIPDIYWIGIANHKLGSFSKRIESSRYIKNNQCFAYDGKLLQKIKLSQ